MSRTDKDTPFRVRSDADWLAYRRCFGSPPAWFVNHRWNARERLAARVDGLNAAKEYRASGVVYTEPTTRQHRHGATWDRS